MTEERSAQGVLRAGIRGGALDDGRVGLARDDARAGQFGQPFRVSRVVAVAVGEDDLAQDPRRRRLSASARNTRFAQPADPGSITLSTPPVLDKECGREPARRPRIRPVTRRCYAGTRHVRGPA